MRYKEIFEIDIETLKKRIDAEKYDKISHFKDRIFIPAINEINDYTELNIEYTFKKTGKKITHIIFRYIEENGFSFAVYKRFREIKLDPERRKTAKAEKKEREERIRQREAAIEAEGTITMMITM